MKTSMRLFFILISFCAFGQMQPFDNFPEYGLDENEPTAEVLKKDSIRNVDIVSVIKKINLNQNLVLLLHNHKPGLKVYFYNNTAIEYLIPAQDSKIQMILEAKQDEVWKPIQFLTFSTCGMSYQSETVQPEGLLVREFKLAEGDFKTKIRVKILDYEDNVFYSNPVNFNIDSSMFDFNEADFEKYNFGRMLKFLSKEEIMQLITLDSEISKKLKAKLQEEREKIKQSNKEKKEENE